MLSKNTLKMNTNVEVKVNINVCSLDSGLLDFNQNYL